MTHDEKIVEAVARVLEPKCRGFCGGSNDLSMGCAREFARAAITAFQAEAWQDISTAPKDGARIYVLIPYDTDIHSYEQCVDIGWWADGCFRFHGDDGPDDIQPTHWQPLPNLPASP
jgi:hypothetical protein